MMKKWKRPLLLGLWIVGAFVLVAVVIGVLNATVAKGKLTFGWIDYRYDSTGYELGEGSLPFTAIEQIEVDWLGGSVEVVSCQDTYISLTEISEQKLADSARVRWAVSEDGKTLRIKCRKSGWFFGGNTNSNDKKLILRVPERYFAQITSFSVHTQGADITVKDLAIDTVSLSSVSGDIEWDAAYCPDVLSASATNGNVTLRLPEDASFTLQWSTKQGRLISDFMTAQTENGYVVADGLAVFTIDSPKGNLILAAKQNGAQAN